MTWKIRYTPQALRDMDAGWEGVFKASGDYDTADRYVEKFADEIAQKKEYPKSGIPLEYNGLFVGYYSVIYKAYRAFYRVRNEYIEVLRIVLIKQEYMKALTDLAEESASEPDATFHEETE